MRSVFLNMALLEGLIVAEVSDGEAQRVDRNHRVGHLIFHNEDHMADILLALRHVVGTGSVIKFFEIDRGPIGWTA